MDDEQNVQEHDRLLQAGTAGNVALFHNVLGISSCFAAVRRNREHQNLFLSSWKDLCHDPESAGTDRTFSMPLRSVWS
jgi:hypothetical protein